MDIEKKIDGQGDGTDPGDEGLDNGNNGQPGKGDAGDAGQTIKIGDKEYTPEQLKEIAEKAGHYDELLPEFTRKSQELAEYKKGNGEGKDGGGKDGKTLPPYHDPNWVPKSYKELGEAMKMAEERGEQRALERLQAMETQRNEAKTQVDNFVAETKKVDKAFDENDFFEFVAKHKLSVNSVDDLKNIYGVYRETRDATINNKGEDGKERKDSVSGGGAGKGSTFSVPINEIRKSGSAVEAALEAFVKIKK